MTTKSARQPTALIPVLIIYPYLGDKLWQVSLLHQLTSLFDSGLYLASCNRTISLWRNGTANGTQVIHRAKKVRVAHCLRDLKNSADVPQLQSAIHWLSTTKRPNIEEMRNNFFWIHMYHTSTSHHHQIHIPQQKHTENNQKTIHFQNLPEIFVALRGNPIPPCRPRRVPARAREVLAEAVGSGASTARWNRWRGSKRPDHCVPELVNGHFRNLNWRYLSYIRPYMVLAYLHFRILEFPLSWAMTMAYYGYIVGYPI